MKLELPEHIDRDKWLGMLGKDGTADPGVTAKYMDECEYMLEQTAEPMGTYVISGDLDYPGKAIARHLENCGRVVLMAVTLGRGVDEKLTRLMVSDMAAGVVFDAGATILVEEAADIFEGIIREKTESGGLFMTGRFSPGYGDLPLSTQRKVIRLLDAQKRIGLTLNGSDLMIPLKSTTAICGISGIPVKGTLATCDECILRDGCEKRKAGRICGTE